jgi:hypothetical protein
LRKEIDMDENAKRLARHAAETRRAMAAGEFSAFPAPMPKPARTATAATAAPAARQAPVKATSEIYKQSYANMAAQFRSLTTMNSLCDQYGVERHPTAVEFVERGLTVDQARAELAQIAATRGWSAALAGVNSPMH